MNHRADGVAQLGEVAIRVSQHGSKYHAVCYENTSNIETTGMIVVGAKAQ